MAVARTDDWEYQDLETSEYIEENMEEIEDGNESVLEDKTCSSNDETELTKDNQDSPTFNFLQLPKARQDLMNNYRKDLEKAIARPYETVGYILESGGSMIKSKIEPAERAIESGSNLIKSYQEPINNMLEAGATIINNIKQPMVSMQEVVMSGSNTILTKAASFTGRYGTR